MLSMFQYFIIVIMNIVLKDKTTEGKLELEVSYLP